MERQLQSTQQQMKDAEDEYEKAEKRLQEQLRETREQLNAAQRVLLTFCLSYGQLSSPFKIVGLENILQS